MITVWGRRNSLNVQKVMWTLGELGVDYIRHDTGGSFGVTDAYRAMNPNATVPTVQDDDGDVTVYESNACVRYLARKYGSGSLCPTNPGDAAVADQWMDWQGNVFSGGFFPMFFNLIRVPADQANRGAIERCAQQCAALIRQLDAHLAGQPYLAGDTLTMGDIPLATLFYRYYTLDIERPSAPAVEAYYQRISERPAYRYHVMIPYGTDIESWQVEEQKNAGIQ